MSFSVVSVKKERATHFSILAWNVSWTEEPGGLQSMGLLHVTTVHGLLLQSMDMSKHTHADVSKQNFADLVRR